MKKALHKRRLALLAGLIIYICLGFVYSWSNYIDFMERDESWSRTDIALAFTVCMIDFSLACVAGGTLAQKIGHVPVIRIGSLMMLAGLLGTGFSSSVFMLCTCYGVLYGLGLGITYIAAMPCVQQRFPDRLGLISGALLMVYGLGGTIWGSIATRIMVTTSWETGFKLMAVIISALIFISSSFLHEPKDEEKAYLDELNAKLDVQKSDTGTTSDPKKDFKETGIEADLRTMLSRKSFWLYFSWFSLISSLWLGAVGQAATFALDMGASLRVATLTAGAITFCNGAGRIVVGWLHDNVERRKVMMGISVIVLIAVVLMYVSLRFGILWLLILSVAMTGLGYGASATTNPVFIRRFFGEKNYSQNLGIVNCNGLVGAILGSTMGPLLIEKYSGYDVMMIYFIMLIVVAFVLQLWIKRP